MNRKYKLALLGDTCSGKTSILRTLKGQEWNSNTAMTIGIDIVIKRETVGDRIYELEIFDTSGVPKYNSIVSQFLKQSNPSIDGIILCIDINNLDYISQILNWKSMLAECLLDIPIIIAANKADLKHRMLSTPQFQDFQVIETSAKSGSNLKQLLQTMLQLILQKKSSIKDRKTEKKSQWSCLCCNI